MSVVVQYVQLKIKDFFITVLIIDTYNRELRVLVFGFTMGRKKRKAQKCTMAKMTLKKGSHNFEIK